MDEPAPCDAHQGYASNPHPEYIVATGLIKSSRNFDPPA